MFVGGSESHINICLQNISGKIQLRTRGQGIALHAPSHGLQEVYFDMNTWKVSTDKDDRI